VNAPARKLGDDPQPERVRDGGQRGKQFVTG